MKRNLPIFIAILSLLIAAASGSFAIKANQKKKQAETETKTLRMQIARMQNSHPNPTEGILTPPDQEPQPNTNALPQLATETTPPLNAEKANQPPQRESWEERMDKMKEEDPEGYAEMIERKTERQQTIRYNLAERTATFMDLDTSSMTAEEQANHEILVEKMAQVWALTEQFQDPEAATNRESMRELFTEIREVRPLLDQERTVMFKQLGSDLGYEGEESEAFASHVEDIINATTLEMPKGGGGRGR